MTRYDATGFTECPECGFHIRVMLPDWYEQPDGRTTTMKGRQSTAEDYAVELLGYHLNKVHGMTNRQRTTLPGHQPCVKCGAVVADNSIARHHKWHRTKGI